MEADRRRRRFSALSGKNSPLRLQHVEPGFHRGVVVVTGRRTAVARTPRRRRLSIAPLASSPMSQSTAKSEPTRGRSAGDDLELGAAEALSRQADRSEEHTSELQSLMRISYAVFCLKKKNIHN